MVKIFYRYVLFEEKHEIEINENALGKELFESIKKFAGHNRFKLVISDEKGIRLFRLYQSKTIKELGVKEGITLTQTGSYCDCCGPFRVETIDNVETKKYQRGINLVCLCSKCLKKGEFIISPEIEINKKFNLSDFNMQCPFCKNNFELKNENSKIKVLILKLSFYQCDAKIIYDDRIVTEIECQNENQIKNTIVINYQIKEILENQNEILNDQNIFNDYKNHEFFIKKIK